MKSYEINDPWDWVTTFENEVARIYWLQIWNRM